jgi:acetylornithine deacetylase/succinyl-diaminopimelate desuccinylase-like protein
MTAGTVDLDAIAARASAEVGDAALREALAALTARPSPHGEERALAEEIAAWGRRRYPDLAWDVDPLNEASANLFARSALGDARELVVYGHLDTSLTGTAADAAITGEASEPPAITFDERSRSVRGFGAGVAKAPSAAGLAAFASAAAALRANRVPHRLTLMLAAGGTHRAADGARFGPGVTHALAGGWRPAAVLNVKGGPAGVVYEEPAAAYVRVRLRRRWSAAHARRRIAPDGGLARHAGAVLDAIERWRERFVASRGQLASEVGIGAIASGSPAKPDLLPGVLDIHLYVMHHPEQDAAAVARELAAALAPAVAALPGAPTLAVDVVAAAPGGRADPASDVVRLAAAAGSRYLPAAEPVRDWTGATDGALFLAAGIPTARLGPNVTREDRDPRIEIVSFDELLAAARAYVDVAVRFFGAERA